MSDGKNQRRVPRACGAVRETGDVRGGDRASDSGGGVVGADTVEAWYRVETEVRTTIRRLYGDIESARAISGDNGAGCFEPCGPKGGAGESQMRARLADERLRAKAASARAARLRREEWSGVSPLRRLRRRLTSIH